MSLLKLVRKDDWRKIPHGNYGVEFPIGEKVIVGFYGEINIWDGGFEESKVHDNYH